MRLLHGGLLKNKGRVTVLLAVLSGLCGSLPGVGRSLSVWGVGAPLSAAGLGLPFSAPDVGAVGGVHFVTSCPVVLDQPGGLYLLSRNLRCSGDAITITANNVQFVLGGYTLAGNGSGAGIRVARGVWGAQISSGTITGFRCGIRFDGASRNSVRAVTSYGNAAEGIFLADNSAGNAIQANNVHGNGLGGIVLDALANGNALQGNTITRNGLEGIALVGGGGATNNTFLGNVCLGNVVGIFMGPGTRGNTALGNQADGSRDFDLFDQNLPRCVNRWQGNAFRTDNEGNGPGAGCIQ